MNSSWRSPLSAARFDGYRSSGGMGQGSLAGRSHPRIQLPALHAAQRRVVAQSRRFNVVCAGRRIGKTVLGMDRLVVSALHGAPVAWMSPTYKMLAEVWRTLRGRLAPVITAASEQQRRMELMTGGTIEMWSLDHAEAIRGRKYQRVVVDEAAMVRHASVAWQEVIRPTLTDLVGDAWMLSTPKGRGFFWECFQRGQVATQGEWRSWQLPTRENPYLAREEIEAMRQELPERVFLQEIEAQFLQDGDGVFRWVCEAATAEEQQEACEGHAYVIGVDWARTGDYSCFVVFDATIGEAVLLDRCRDTAFALQLGRLRGLYERFKPYAIIAEENSMGMPLVEQLGGEGLPVQGFKTTNASKQGIIDALVLAFEQRAIRILNDPALVGELLAYEMERLPSGLVRYGAPAGQHDDTVMALALAWYGASRGGSLVLW